jgi:hypothetical protein
MAGNSGRFAAMSITDDLTKKVHYKHFLRSLEIADAMTPTDRAIIRKKPSGYEHTLDMAWRQVCDKYGIMTCALGTSFDRTVYSQIHALNQRVAELKAELNVKSAELAKLATRSAHDNLVVARDVVRRGEKRKKLMAKTNPRLAHVVSRVKQ